MTYISQRTAGENAVEHFLNWFSVYIAPNIQTQFYDFITLVHRKVIMNGQSKNNLFRFSKHQHFFICERIS